MTRLTVTVVVVVASGGLAGHAIIAADDAWGTLSGRFIVERASSESPPEGIGGIAVYLEPAKEQKLAIHPDYETQERKGEERTIEIRDSGFVPCVTFLRTDQPLVVKNVDAIEHSAAGSPRVGESPAFRSRLAPGESQRFQFSEPGWQRIACNVHAHEAAYLVVRPHPYGAVTSSDGRFEIKNLPVGQHAFRVWRPPTGYLRQATLEGKPVEWKRGQVQLTIRPGKNDLGDILVPHSVDAAPAPAKPRGKATRQPDAK